MTRKSKKIVLGSRSPRRLELLRHVVPYERIVVMPPRSADEAGFAGITDWDGIEQRLLEIARSKCDDVQAWLATPDAPLSPNDVLAVITADTVIVGIEDDGSPNVLGQPPEDESWPGVVRQWFMKYYIGKTHIAVTALCVARADGRRSERVVRSDVTFRADCQRWLDWYIASGEPRGKAGGYALQGAGGIFIEMVEGSLSNVVGLPLAELMQIFEELGIALVDRPS